MSSDKEPLPSIPEELFEKYKASSTNVNLTDRYKSQWIVPSQNPLLFCFTTSSPVTVRNESSDHLLRILEGTEKPIVTRNSHKPLSNEERAAIIRNATKNVHSQLDAIHANFQQHRHQHCTDCLDYYYKTHGSCHQIRGRYIGLNDTICSICGHKGYGYLSCSWIAPVLQKEKEFQANQQIFAIKQHCLPHQFLLLKQWKKGRSATTGSLPTYYEILWGLQH